MECDFTSTNRIPGFPVAHSKLYKFFKEVAETVLQFLSQITHQAKHYLIVVDAHSKWPEVIGPTKTTTADSTINTTDNIFDRYGLPTQVVSNNGPPFQSAEYEELLQHMAFREF